MINPKVAHEPHAMRYAILEAVIERDKRLTTAAVAQILNCSMGHAGRIIREYLQRCEENWFYSNLSTDRAWLMNTGYERQFLDPDTYAEEYITSYALLTGQNMESLP